MSSATRDRFASAPAFPIPMRGNEDSVLELDSVAARGFPIPMRGNEFGSLEGEAPGLPVSDPHEG